MKSAPLAALALIVPLLAPGASAAGERFNGFNSSCDSPARWADRHDVRDAELAITTEDGHVTLVLTDRVVAVQLSDRVMHRIERKLKAKEDRFDDHAVGRAIRTAVLSSVRSILDHSQECPVRRIESAEFRDGRLVLVTDEGDELFEDLDVDDRDVMDCFSPRDARLFVREFERIRAQAGR